MNKPIDRYLLRKQLVGSAASLGFVISIVIPALDFFTGAKNGGLLMWSNLIGFGGYLGGAVVGALAGGAGGIIGLFAGLIAIPIGKREPAVAETEAA